MTMNKAIGQMYPFLNDYPIPNANRGYTWNPVGGECLHRCSYCYVKYGRTKNLKKYQGMARIDEKCMKDNLGNDNFIFVGSANDMFGDWVSDDIIRMVIRKCSWFDNKYLFQSKNPERFRYFLFPKNTILGTTIESNYNHFISIGSVRRVSKAPTPTMRAKSMEYHWMERMVSIEPIMDFDLEPFVKMIKSIKPVFVSIGADSKKTGLPEPSPEKIRMLIKELKKFTEVKIKPNLGRLMLK